MLNTIADILTSNEKVPYNIVFPLVIAYFVFLWLVICIWVFKDAHKRYGKLGMAILWSVLVFFLNFPTLILYLILRPEENWWDEIAAIDNAPQYAAVEVPVVNLVDENGVHLAIELKITPQTAMPALPAAVMPTENTKRALPEANKTNVTVNLQGLLSKFKSPKQIVEIKPEEKVKKVEPQVEQVVKVEPEVPVIPTQDEVTIMPEEMPAATMPEPMPEEAPAPVEIVAENQPQIEQPQAVEQSTEQPYNNPFPNFNRRKKKRRR